jgi:hypothetical protein
MAALRDHFGRTDKDLTPEEIAEMAGLDLTLTQNSLRVLHAMKRIEGVTVAEINYPLRVTNVVW